MKHILTVIVFLMTSSAYCHDLHYDQVTLHEWTVNTDTKIKASFLMFKNKEVYLQNENSQTVHFPLADFSQDDQQYINHRYNEIQRLNSQHVAAAQDNYSTKSYFDYSKLFAVAALLLSLLSLAYFFGNQNKVKYFYLFFFVATLSVFYSFKIKSMIFSITDPSAVNIAFIPFKPNVVTSWDANYFYVESFGIPTTHGMMNGITNWQQQVPIPQCYIKPNAWQIPLNPVVATTPVPVNASHFTRGAIALAVNGIAIFNPYTNTGADAYLTGQLDQWGGHCGKADDYHYHIAPMQLYNNTATTKAIAYALDGFAVYGTVEPNGSVLLALDANHGHYWNGVYHYHGTATPVAPYMIANMVGQVTEDATNQIIPQPNANPVRPPQNPLSGAVITNCVANGSNGYTLTYTLGGNTNTIAYSWSTAGQYTFNFNTSTGTTISTYNGFIPCQLPTTLPVSLINFDLQKLDKKTIQLFWSTATEVNNDYFLVEKSYDAVSWKELSKVKAKANSTTTQKYSVFDLNPSVGTTYYRLKQVDLDSKFSYSKILSNKFTDKFTVNIYPNPASNHISFTEAQNEIEIYNSTGQIVVPKERNVSTVAIEHLPKGVYFAKILDINNNVTNIKFLKQ